MTIHEMSGVDRVVIAKVGGPFPTRHPLVQQYLIEAQLAERPDIHRQYETVNQFRASLCKRYEGTAKPLSVRWRRTPYGRDLQSVEAA